MSKKVTAANFLKNMGLDEQDQAETTAPAAVKERAPAKGRVAAVSRSELKHFGGYIGQETEEIIAILRARMKLDNSKLIERAMRELYDRETAAKKFGDR